MVEVPPHQRHPQVPSFAQTSTPKYDLFSEPLLWIVTFQEMTIKYLMYMEKVPFLYTERACVVVFWFQNSPWKILCVEKSVVSISDQREYNVVCCDISLNNVLNAFLIWIIVPHPSIVQLVGCFVPPLGMKGNALVPRGSIGNIYCTNNNRTTRKQQQQQEDGVYKEISLKMNVK